MPESKSIYERMLEHSLRAYRQLHKLERVEWEYEEHERRSQAASGPRRDEEARARRARYLEICRKVLDEGVPRGPKRVARFNRLCTAENLPRITDKRRRSELFSEAANKVRVAS